MIAPVESYQSYCEKQVPEQYKRSEKLLSLIGSVLSQCDDLEKAFGEILPMLDPQQAIGPALDYIGKITGTERTPGETDAHYRPRVLESFHSAPIPSPEALRGLIQMSVGRPVMLVPCWPAALYFVVDGSAGEIDTPALEAEYMPSGVALGQGTYICGEPTEDGKVDFGFIVSEDNGMPIVCDYMRYALEFMLSYSESHSISVDGDLIDSDGNVFIDDAGNALQLLEQGTAISSGDLITSDGDNIVIMDYILI